MKKQASEPRKIAGIGDAAVKAKTGKIWQEWLTLLDAADAQKMDHPAIARHLSEQGCPYWWSHMVTVGYEQESGLREKHQTPSGYRISGSKTIVVPLSALYAAWEDATARRRWLKAPGLRVRRATEGKSIRIAWADGSSVDVDFYTRGPAKSQVTVQHGKLAGAEEAARMQAFWAQALGQLKRTLES
ncbi:MAG: hypothetical protein EXR60_06320 [Dehalococcoidia bacterium]|nr:hypothetical protein [Dehalococcoidia bacterium]